MLFTSRNAASIIDEIKIKSGIDLYTLINKTKINEVIDSAYIVGSIPAGISSKKSDLDIYIIVNKEVSSENFTPDILNMAEQVKWYSSDDDPLVIGEIIFNMNGVKVDIELLRTSGIESICDRLDSPHTLLNASDIDVFGKIRAGWSFPSFSGELGKKISSKNKAFDIYVTTQCLFMAVKWFNKSMIVSDDTYIHSALLARYAVEQCFRAYLASIGYAALSAKWVQFLVQGSSELSDSDNKNFNEVRECGLKLLFPEFEVVTHEKGFIEYLEKVRNFLLVTEKVISSNIEYKISFSLNGEISVPKKVSLV